MERKLAAILHADVKGYSRLMGEDEVATLRTLTPYLEMMSALVRQHGGRVAGSAGDSLLAEFPSVVEAVQCAGEMQHELKGRNAALPVARRVEFRMGINLGEIVVEGEQIHGDGINIAVRLEGVAEAGGICISEVVYKQIKNKLALEYEDLGEYALKNIAEPVRVWRVVMGVPSPLVGEDQGEGATGRAGTVTTSHPDLPLQGGKELKNRRWGTARLTRAALVLVGLLIIGGLVALLSPSFPPLITHHSSLSTQEAQPPLPFPYKPSLAVLPFVNISEDPKQDYFSDGMTDTLITDLSQLSALFVIARNSTFVYKSKAVRPQQVNQELGVRYVVEGSVQKADTQVRIAVQLVEATTGHQLWAERYDRELRDIFALQDELARRIVG